MPATYVYAIIPTTEPLLFDAAGMDDDNDAVYAISQPGLARQGLAAVVSVSPILDYRGLHRNQAVRYLVAHQRVVEAVMEGFPVLPVKFGTALPDETWVHRLLAQGAPLFDATLKKIANRVQMEIVVLWPLQDIFQEIAREPSIAQLKMELDARPDAVTAADRIALGQRVQQALEQRRAELRDYLLPSLCQGALDVVSNPLLDDSMVINIALLLDETERQSLDEQVKRLDSELSGRLTFRCIGPLPPYSFATVELQRPSFEEIDAARRRLGLGEKATLGEIRRAYHQLARQIHPDHSPALPDAADEMASLAQAHELLSAYGSSWAQQAESLASPCCFGREAVERTLLIRVGRQEVAA